MPSRIELTGLLNLIFICTLEYLSEHKKGTQTVENPCLISTEFLAVDSVSAQLSRPCCLKGVIVPRAEIDWDSSGSPEASGPLFLVCMLCLTKTAVLVPVPVWVGDFFKFWRCYFNRYQGMCTCLEHTFDLILVFKTTETIQIIRSRIF